MSQKSLPLSDAIYPYLLAHSLTEHPLQIRLREDTADHPMARMAIAPEQGQLLALLARLLPVRRYLEIGVFTGYSSLTVALNQPAGGSMVVLEKNQEWAEIAQSYWHKAGVGDRVDLRIGNAVETLPELVAENPEPFDMIFIDADKPHYPMYYETALNLIRPGGLIIIDNVFWHGNVANKADHDPDVEALRKFNDYVTADARVFSAMVPLGDGMTLAYKAP